MVHFSGCGPAPAPTTQETPEDPATPILTAEDTEAGKPVMVKISMPHNGWRVDPDTPVDHAFVRINGREYICTFALSPFTSASVELDLKKELSDPPSWTEGEYRITYVLKDFNAVHRDLPIERYIEELVSNEIVISIY